MHPGDKATYMKNGFLFTLGVIRALEARRLNMAQVEQIIFAASITEALKHLKMNQVFGFQPQENEWGDFRTVITGRLSWILEFLRQNCPNSNLEIFFRLPYDYHNLKLLLKNKILVQTDLQMLAANGTIPPFELLNILEQDNLTYLPGFMELGVVLALEQQQNTQELMAIDLCLDRALYQDLLAQACTTGSEFIKGYLRLKIDSINILTRARKKKYRFSDKLLPLLYLKDGNLKEETLNDPRLQVRQLFLEMAESMDYPCLLNEPIETSLFLSMERSLEEMIFAYLNNARFLIQGIEPIFAFGAIVEMETRALGMALGMLKAGWEGKEIQQRFPRIF
jgi:V/A-type H+-transporting ATPase subunit C